MEKNKQSINWKNVFLLISLMYFYTIVYWLFSNEKIIDLIVVNTILLILFIGIPLISILYKISNKKINEEK